MLITILLLVRILGGTASVQTPFFAFSWDDGAIIEATACDTMTMAWVWLATTQGLIYVSVNTSEVTIQVVDSTGGIRAEHFRRLSQNIAIKVPYVHAILHPKVRMYFQQEMNIQFH